MERAGKEKEKHGGRKVRRREREKGKGTWNLGQGFVSLALGG